LFWLLRLLSLSSDCGGTGFTTAAALVVVTKLHSDVTAPHAHSDAVALLVVLFFRVG
jgi:hypothetical protein